MKKQWKLLPKIISGEKTIESRWYKTKRTPWNKIKPGETLYFQDSGEKITVSAKVTKVEQYKIKDNNHALQIAKEYALKGLGATELPQEIIEYNRDKKYAMFIHFDNVTVLKKPFSIDKSGFGLQTAWITTPSVEILKKDNVEIHKMQRVPRS